MLSDLKNRFFRSQLPADREIALNTDTVLLKIVAAVFMLIDHVGLVLMGNNMVLRSIGRIAYPLYAWCAVVGCTQTHDFGKYLKRLTLLYLVSQPIYVLTLNKAWTSNNILLTIILGVLAIRAIRVKEYWLLPLVLVISYLAGPDYGIKGVYIILLLYLVRGSKPLAAILLSIFCVMWGKNTTVVCKLWDYPIRIQSLAIFALPLIIIPTHSGYRQSPAMKFVFYAFYPAHLLVLLLIKEMMALF